MDIKRNDDGLITSLPYSGGKTRGFVWEGQDLKSMTSPTNDLWEHLKSDGKYIDSWRTTGGTVWNGTIEVDQASGRVTLLQSGWPNGGSKTVIAPNGDRTLWNPDQSHTTIYTNKEVVTYDGDGKLIRYQGLDGNIRELRNWKLDANTGEMQPYEIKVTTANGVFNWSRKDNCDWEVNGRPSTTRFSVDSKNGTYIWTDTDTGVTNRLVAGQFKETSERIGWTDFLNREHGGGYNTVERADGKWQVLTRNGLIERVFDAGQIRKLERDDKGKIAGITDVQTKTSWHRDPSGQWTAKSMDENPANLPVELSGDMFVDARGLCVMKGKDGSLKKLDMSGHLVELNKPELARALAETSDLPKEAKARFALSAEILEQRTDTDSSEKDKSFEQLIRLMQSKNSASPFNTSERMQLAEELVWQLARPERQEQGQHNTCNVTSIRSSLIKETPSDFAKLAADVIINGKCVTSDGTTVVPPVDSMKKHCESHAFPSNGGRSWLSQIADVTMANIFWQRQTRDTYGYEVPKGSLVYEQFEHAQGDTGERMHKLTPDGNRQYQLKNRDDNFLARSPSLYGNDLRDIYEQITGRSQEHRFIINKSISYASDKTDLVSCEKDFETSLTRGPWPKIVAVHTSRDPLYQDSGAGTAGGAGGRTGGWHVVVANSYDPKSGHVPFDNQWHPDSDRNLPSRQVKLPQLYEATVGAIR